MSFVTLQAAHCDVCGHEWLTELAPTHCASSKCRSRRWNTHNEIAASKVQNRRLSKAVTISPEAISQLRELSNSRTAKVNRLLTVRQVMAKNTEILAQVQIQQRETLRQSQAINPAVIAQSQLLGYGTPCKECGGLRGLHQRGCKA